MNVNSLSRLACALSSVYKIFLLMLENTRLKVDLGISIEKRLNVTSYTINSFKNRSEPFGNLYRC